MDACPAGSLGRWCLWRSALLAVLAVNVLSLLQPTSLLLRTVNKKSVVVDLFQPRLIKITWPQ
ncbi:rCG53931, partial [Rattus norvegicus]